MRLTMAMLACFVLICISSSRTLSALETGAATNAQAVTTRHYDGAATQKSDSGLVPIRSAAQLSEYLETHPSSPLDAFNKRARKLFLDSLTFSEKGLTGFRLQEIQSELTPSQAFDILSFFGVQSVIESLQFEHTEDSKPSSTDSGAAETDGILAAFADTARTINREADEKTQMVTQLQRVVADMLKAVDFTGIARLSRQDIKDLHEVAGALAFYSNEPADVRQMRRGYDELEKRGLATRLQGQAMRDQYVTARMIPEAMAFAAQRPGLNLNKIPRFEKPESELPAPSLWHLSADGTRLAQQSFHLGSEPHVIVVASPWCSFSQRASQTLQATPDLARLMAEHSTWILPQFRIPDFADIEKWNQSYADWPLLLVNKDKEWPDLELFEVPKFFFFRGGKVVSTVTGWPGDEQLEKLREGISSIGLWTDSAATTNK